MFSTDNYIVNVHDVPSEWMLEKYLSIPSHMIGNNFKIKSIFNPKDSDPSLSIYYSTGSKNYRFTDFSSGKKGSVIDLVMEIYGESFADASKRIMNDYINRDKTKSVKKLVIKETKWVVKNLVKRKWNKQDAKYWSSYNISSEILNRYNVAPIKSVTLQKIIIETGEVLISYDLFTNSYMYGFFRNDGELYKIYRPYMKKKKFISLGTPYIQGTEQLTQMDTLVISSSLKDLMALSSIIPNIDVVAASSETNIIKADVIIYYKKRYKHIVVMLDSDDTGIKFMMKYHELYKIPICFIPQEKDIADVVKNRKAKEAQIFIVPRLHEAMHKYTILNPKK